MAFYKKSIKKIGRYLRPLKKTFRRRYISKKKGSLRYGKLAKDVMALKQMVNAEKKYNDVVNIGIGIAQLSNGAEGAIVQSITPTIFTGSLYNNRNGNSIRLSGAYVRMQFTQQTNTINRLKFRFTILTVKGLPQTTSQILTGLYEANPITSVRDFFSSRNPAQFTDYNIIKSFTRTLSADNITGQTGILDIMVPLKLKHHIRYNNSSAIQEGELFIMIQADIGDSGVPATGVFMSINTRLFFYDN